MADPAAVKHGAKRWGMLSPVATNHVKMADDERSNNKKTAPLESQTLSLFWSTQTRFTQSLIAVGVGEQTQDFQGSVKASTKNQTISETHKSWKLTCFMH